MSATVRNRLDNVGFQHRLKLLRQHVSGGRPDLVTSDDAVDDALCHMDAAMAALIRVYEIVEDDLLRQDQITAGDLSPQGDPIRYDRYP